MVEHNALYTPRELRKQFSDAQLKADPDAFPPARRSKPRKKDMDSEIPGRASQLLSAVKGSVRQFTAAPGRVMVG